jgi:hypothetical protein
MAVTNVTASLPDLILAPGSTITVTLDDASADITQLNVYGYTPRSETAATESAVPSVFAYAPDAV